MYGLIHGQHAAGETARWDAGSPIFYCYCLSQQVILAVFQTSYIQPGPNNARGPDLAGDRAPHLIGIGENVVPQNWTMTVTSAEGDFKLEGSVTGPDGTGRSTEPFVSDSGQVVMDPAMWRRPERNEVGDIFTWEVYRCALGRVSFRAEGEQPERFRLQLVDGLSNSEHTLQLIAVGDGPVAGEGFEVFEPPLR